jgi:hypothetical protein
MAKLTITYENDIITKVLTFRGQNFTSIMPPWNEEKGCRTGDKGLSYFVYDAFEEDLDIEDICDVIEESLDVGEEDEIEDALRELTEEYE